MIIKVNDIISLELLDEKHAEPVYHLIDENRNYLNQWLPWVEHMQSITDFKNYISKTKNQYNAGTDIAFVIIYKNEPAGRIGLHYIDLQNKSASIGYWLGQNFEKKGIIITCCKELINYAFSTLELNRLEIKCGTGNLKSSAIPERLLFKKEGIIREGEYVNNTFIDLFLFSMLKNEWVK